MTREEKIDFIIKQFESAIQPMIASISNQSDDNDLPPVLRKFVLSTSERVLMELLKEKAYETYTDKDLDILVEFYSSETCKKTMAISQCVMTQEFQEEIQKRVVCEIDKFLDKLEN